MEGFVITDNSGDSVLGQHLEQALLHLEGMAQSELVKAHVDPGSDSDDSTLDLGSEAPSIGDISTGCACPSEMLACTLEPCSVLAWEEEMEKVEAEDWVIEQILSTKYHEGEAYYQVKWHGYLTPTWESEETTVHEGLVRQLLEFKQMEVARRKAQAERRLEASRKAWEAKQQQSKEAKATREDSAKSKAVQWLLAQARVEDRRLTSMALFDPRVFWPNWYSLIGERFREAGCCVLHVENICHRQRAHEFDSRLQASDAERAEPMMVFHGTSAFNIQGIIEDGLQVPGTFAGVKVANGSAYGVGIYTAASPQLGYARDFNYHEGEVSQMFCCAGISHGAQTKQVSGFTIFFEASLVLPCFLVTFRREAAKPPPGGARYPYAPRLVSEVPIKQETSEGSWVTFPRSGLCLPLGAAPDRPLNTALFRSRAGGARVALEGSLALALALARRRRVAYVARGDHENRELRGLRVWYDREHRTLSRRQLRAMPRSAKQPFREGLIGEPKRDRTRARDARRCWEPRCRAKRRSKHFAEEDFSGH